MTKYSNDLKLEIVERLAKEIVSIKELSHQYKIDQSTIQKWRDIYRIHGKEGLCSKNGTYTGDFKKNVVEYIYKTKSSIRQTAAYFGIPSYATVSKWSDIYKIYGAEALYVENRGCASKVRKKKNISKKYNESSTKELLNEIKQLRIEVEYLKKLNALIHERENLKK